MPRIDEIKLRRDTSANWTSTNPVLSLGEPGFETDTRLTKTGDGVTAWNDLLYDTATTSSTLEQVIVNDSRATTKPIFEGNAQVGDGDDSNLELGSSGSAIETDASELILKHPFSEYSVNKNGQSISISSNGGDWNASTNTPTLANTDTQMKDVSYVCNVAGSQDFGAGSITFGVGDVVTNNGLSWYKRVDNNQSGGGGASALNDLTDVTLTSPSNGQILSYNGSNWVNSTSSATLPWFDITDYGAVADALGDSGVDSTTAFTDAIAALQTAGGGVLYFPNTGTDRFNITVNHLTKRDMSNIKIMSFGEGRIFVKDTIGGGGSGQGRGVLVNMDDGTENFTIENMDILVSSGAFRAGFNTGVICSEEGNLRNITIRNCKIKNESKADTLAGVDGITFYRDVTDGTDTATITNLVIEDCDIELYGESVYGIQILRKTYYSNIYHNEIELHAYTSTTDQAFNAIAMYGDSEYFNIQLNYVYSSGHSGIAVSMGSFGTVQNNWVFNVTNPAECGIEVEYKLSHGSASYQTEGVRVINNFVKDCYYGIWVTERDEDATTIAPKNVLIEGNNVYDSTIADIIIASLVSGSPDYTSRISNVKINNNNCESTATGAGIYLYDGQDVSMSGNTLKGGQAYGIRIGLDSTIYPNGYIEANNNKIYDVTNDAIRVFNMEGLFTADNNKIYNPTSRGIYSNAIVGTPRYKWTNNYCEGAIDGFRSTNDRTAILGCTFTNNTSKDCTGFGHNYANDNSIMVNNISDNCTSGNSAVSTGGTTTPNINY